MNTPHSARRTVSALLGAMLTTASLLLASTVVQAGPATAASNGQWSVEPLGTGSGVPRSNFQFQVQPGQTIADKLSVVNTTSHYLDFAIFAADAYNTPNAGAFALRGITEPGTNLAPWVHLPVKQFAAPPRSMTTIPFQVVVPADATPGDHDGGIVALSEAIQGAEPGSVGFNVQRGVGVRIYLSVAGPRRPGLLITSFGIHRSEPALHPITGGGDAVVSYTVQNSGNISEAFTARLSVKDVFGRTVKQFAPRSLPDLLPGQSFQVSERWGSLPLFGLQLRPELTLDSSGATTSTSTSVMDVPWVLVVLVVLLIALAVWVLRRRSSRDIPADAPAEPEPVSDTGVKVLT